MWQDPIVKETRELREKYASKMGHSIDAIFKDIRNRQSKRRKSIVSFPSRKPQSIRKIA